MNLKQFVENVAGMTRNGEMVDGVPFEMSPEDACETLQNLISQAREITGWIDKMVDMPEDGQSVEVLGDDGKIREAYGAHICGVKGFMVNATAGFVEGNKHYEITHWRPARNKQGEQ